MASCYTECLKWFNVGIGVTVLIIAVVSFFLNHIDNVVGLIMPIFTFLFGIITLSGDFKIRIILVHCGFLANFYGRG